MAVGLRELNNMHSGKAPNDMEAVSPYLADFFYSTSLLTDLHWMLLWGPLELPVVFPNS